MMSPLTLGSERSILKAACFVIIPTGFKDGVFVSEIVLALALLFLFGGVGMFGRCVQDRAVCSSIDGVNP